MFLERNDIHLWVRRKQIHNTDQFIRNVLSRYLELPPQHIRLSRTANGKPVFKDQRLKSLQFNASNSKGLMVCAVSKCLQLGVDLEYIHRKNSIDEIAARFFHPDEKSHLLSIQDEMARRKYFFELWTAKEAYIKAIGKTIGSVALDKTGFCSNGKILTAYFQLPSHRRWHFETLPWHDYTITVAQSCYRWDTCKPSISLFNCN